jgi:predicted nucleic acid-binding protein
MRASLRDHLVVPSIVVTEYIKIAGKIIGKQAALNQISIMKESGAEVVSLDEQIAVLGGELALRDEKKSIGDTLIAATAISMHASHVVSDDPHFRDFGLKTKWK